MTILTALILHRPQRLTAYDYAGRVFATHPAADAKLKTILSAGQKLPLLISTDAKASTLIVRNSVRSVSSWDF